MTLAELQEKRGRLVNQAREALDEIRANTDESRAKELEDRHDNIMAEFDKLEKDIEREQRLADAERRIAESAERERRERRPGEQREARASDDGEEITYRDAFHEYLRCAGQLGSMQPEARAVLGRGYLDVSKELRAQTTTNAAGGFTIPTELQSILVKSLLAFGPMYDEAMTTVISTTGGNAITIPTVNDTASTAGAHTEGATLTDDGGKDVVFGQKQLDSFAFDTEWLRISKELADDSIFAMEQLIGDLLGERLGRIANSQLTTGTGSAAPNGIVTASTQGKVAAASSAVTFDEIIDLEHSIDPAYRVGPKVAFMFNDSVLQAVRKLKDGQGNYLWQAGNVQGGVPNLINNRRYFINQAMAGFAVNAKTILFGDFSKYFVRKVGAPLIGAIQDKDFWPGFGIAGYIRFDGELVDTAAVKHLAQAAV